MNKYTSPFDILRAGKTNFFEGAYNLLETQSLQNFSGSVEQALESTYVGLQQVLQNGIIPNNERVLLNVLLMNARIIRGILDYKVCKPGADYTELILEWGKISEAIYQCKPEALGLLETFHMRLGAIVQFDIVQRYDAETWKAMDPRYSALTVKKMLQEVGREDYLFISLGHGGIATGFDIFLRLKERAEGEGNFYPIRFSRAKKKDREPRVSSIVEKDFLTQKAQGKIVIIFDEDASSGNTLRKAQEFFQTQISGARRVCIYSNIGVYGSKV